MSSLVPMPNPKSIPTRYHAQSYADQYAASRHDPDVFWATQGQRLDWFKPFTEVKDVSFAQDDLHIRWYADGVLNACYNCLDRHLPAHANKVAFWWQGDAQEVQAQITYHELYEAVCQFANALKARGVVKGDRVAIYMPMVIEAVIAMLACARIGAVHSVIFGGFSPNAIADRVNDCAARLVITSDEGRRGGQTVPLKANVDKALSGGVCPTVETVIMYRLTGAEVAWTKGRDVIWQDLVATQTAECPAEPMAAEDPLFILYTSGSTGQPKGVLHTTGGYMVYAALTHETIFDIQPDDVYWCAADVGWITGHSYIVYGPLANATSSVLFEGVPTSPTSGRVGEIIDKYGVTILYTAPTLIRALMARSSEAIGTSLRTSLRLLGSVGEPINPEAWQWYFQEMGLGQAPIVDTWWQTETGGIMMTPLPGVCDMKPGSTMLPFFGVAPGLMDGEGQWVDGNNVEGSLVLTQSWPGQARTVWGDHERFIQTYFSTFPGVYFTGDGARRDEDGHYWITGRVDDVLNVSGHRLGTAEIESALVAHEAVAEAAVVGVPHDLKGQAIYVFVTLNSGVTACAELVTTLRQWVRQELSPIATPDVIQWASGLPKTRSGKIMRRILRKIAVGEYDSLGDTSTLAEPSVVDSLIKDHKNR